MRAKQLILTLLIGLVFVPGMACADGVSNAEWAELYTEFKRLWKAEDKLEAIKLLGKADDIRAVKQLWVILTKYPEAPPIFIECAEALGRTTGEKSLKFLTGNVSGKMDHHKRSILCEALARVKRPIVVDTFKKMLEAKEPQVRTVGIDSLGLMRDKSVVPDLIELMKTDPFWQVRYSAVVALVMIGDKRAVPALIDRLDREQGRVRGDILKALKALTGKLDLDSTAEWKAWWTKHKDDRNLRGGGISAFRNTRKTGSNVRKGDGTDADPKNSGSVVVLERPTYYGITVYSSRLVFVIDISESMLSKWSGKVPEKPQYTVALSSKSGEDEYKRTATLNWNKVKTKWDLAREQMIFTLNQLDPRTEFTMIFYASRVKVWKRQMVKASEPNVTAAIGYLKKLKVDGKTNIYDAMQKGFTFGGNKDPLHVSNYKSGADTLFFLSDGFPTVGKIVGGARDSNWAQEMIDEIKTWNRLRKIKIHCVGIGRHPKHFMRNMAGQFGGDYVIPGEEDLEDD